MHTGCLISDETLCTSFSAYTNLLRTRINHNLRWIYKVKGFWNVQLTTLADYTTLVLTVWRKFCLLLWSQFLCCSQFRVPAQLVFRDVWKQLHNQASYAMKYHASQIFSCFEAFSSMLSNFFELHWMGCSITIARHNTPNRCLSFDERKFICSCVLEISFALW